MRRGSATYVVPRRGLATLETALALPVLALLAAVLFAVGRAGIARLHGSEEVRQKAWKQRHGSTPGGRLTIRPTQADLLREEVSHAVKGPPVLSGIAAPTVKARHAVLAGSLDFHDVPLSRPPEIDYVRNMAGTLPGFGGGDLGGLLASLTGSQLADSFSPLDALQAEGQQGIDQANQKWQDASNKLQEQRQKLRAQLLAAQQKVDALTQGVSGLDKRIADLQQQRKKAESIADKVKRKQMLDSLDRQIKTAQAQDDAEKKQYNAAFKELQKLRVAEAVDKLHP